MVISANCRTAIEDLKEEFQNALPGRAAHHDTIGPSGVSGINIVRPGDDWLRIRLPSVSQEATFRERSVKMYLGIATKPS